MTSSDGNKRKVIANASDAIEVRVFEQHQREHERRLALAVDDPLRVWWVEREGSGAQPLRKPNGYWGETCACLGTIVQECQHWHTGDRKPYRMDASIDALLDRLRLSSHAPKLAGVSLADLEKILAADGYQALTAALKAKGIDRQMDRMLIASAMSTRAAEARKASAGNRKRLRAQEDSDGEQRGSDGSDDGGGW